MNYDSLIAAAEKAGTPDVLVELDGAFTSLRKEYGCWLKTDGTDIGAPDVEEKLEYPPGLDAVLDMTQGLDSKVHFKQRAVSLAFAVLRPQNQWENLRSSLETALQGQWLRFRLSNSTTIREGLFTVELTPGAYTAAVSIRVTCAP